MAKTAATQAKEQEKATLEVPTDLSREWCDGDLNRITAIACRRVRALCEDQEFPLAHELGAIFAITTCSRTSTPTKSSP